MTESPPPLTMRDYAAVLAYLSHYPGEQRADVLDRLEVSEGEWKEADKRWPAAMIQELLDEDHSLSDAFNDAFVSVKRRLKKEKPDIESLTPLRPSTSSAAKPLVVPAEPPAQPASAPAASVFAPSAPVFAPPAPVFAPPAPVFAPPALISSPPAPVVASDHESLVPLGMRNFKSLKGTHAVVDAAPAPALPFRAPITGEPSAMAKAEPRSLVPEGMRGFTSLSGTQGVNPLPAGPALPFAGAKGPPPAPPPPAPPPPIVGKPPSDLPSLSVEQYASLCVELELEPERTAETLQRYRLTPEQRVSLDASWRERLAQASGLYAAWTQAVTRYKTWKLQQPRR
jgi:hypothetical protein